MLARAQVPAAPAWEAVAHDPARKFSSCMQWYTVLSIQGALPLDHISLKEHQMPCCVVLDLQWWDLGCSSSYAGSRKLKQSIDNCGLHGQTEQP